MQRADWPRMAVDWVVLLFFIVLSSMGCSALLADNDVFGLTFPT